MCELSLDGKTGKCSKKRAGRFCPENKRQRKMQNVTLTFNSKRNEHDVRVDGAAVKHLSAMTTGSGTAYLSILDGGECGQCISFPSKELLIRAVSIIYPPNRKKRAR
jgi:hypothetical protein